MDYSDMNKDDVAEIERIYRVVDLMTTAHAVLRDRYKWRSSILSVCMILTAVLLCGFTFSNSGTFLSVGLDPDWAGFVMGIVSVVLLGLSICEWKVDWKAVSERHREAYDELASLKPKLRIAREAEINEIEKVAIKANKDFSKVCERIVPIPDRQFVSLKSKHLKKIELSKLLSRHPKCPCSLLVLIMWFQGIRSVKSGKVDADQARNKPSAERGKD